METRNDEFELIKHRPLKKVYLHLSNGHYTVGDEGIKSELSLQHPDFIECLGKNLRNQRVTITEDLKEIRKTTDDEIMRHQKKSFHGSDVYELVIECYLPENVLIKNQSGQYTLDAEKFDQSYGLGNISKVLCFEKENSRGPSPTSPDQIVSIEIKNPRFAQENAKKTITDLALKKQEFLNQFLMYRDRLDGRIEAIGKKIGGINWYNDTSEVRKDSKFKEKTNKREVCDAFIKALGEDDPNKSLLQIIEEVKGKFTEGTGDKKRLTQAYKDFEKGFTSPGKKIVEAMEKEHAVLNPKPKLTGLGISSD